MSNGDSVGSLAVAPAHGEDDVERREIDGEHAQRMVDIEEHARAGCVRCRNDAGQLLHHLTRLEQHLRHDEKIGASRERIQLVRRSE